MAALQKTSTFNTALIAPKSTIVIGLSGGPDSVYLLHQLLDLQESLGLSLVAAHLDHEWRSCSKNDADFCKNLCLEKKVIFVTKKASELQADFTYNGSQEELGRSMRRFFLEEVARNYQADAIALGHHQDDQLETFFINLIRGTNIKGLGGMQEKEGLYIRPLLALTKQEILTYLTKTNLRYVTDPTNISDEYLRNRIRNHLLPAFTKCDERFSITIPRAIMHFQDTEKFLETVTQDSLHAVCTSNEHSSQALNLVAFRAINPYLQNRIIKKWFSLQLSQPRCSTAYFQEIIRFLTSARGGMHQIDLEHVIVKKQKHAWIKKHTVDKTN